MVKRYQVKEPSFDNVADTLLEITCEMALLEGPYFINLAKLPFKVISKCSSCAEQHACSSTSMALGQPISHCWSEPSVERQPASKSDGLWKASQENFQIWNATEKKVTTSFNCLLALQKVAFHIFMQILISAQCENQVKKCGKWVCAYVFNWAWCRVPNFNQADQTVGLCKSRKCWNLVAIAAN